MKVGLLSLAIWTPIVFGVILLALGRDDQALIDGAVVNGSWKIVGRISGVVRWLQSGFIYHYAFAMLLGIFILMSYFVWFKR